MAAEFQRPVMLYSIGKDSSVMVRLAQKAFYPGPIPFPLLHIDTTYKFREMIEFRDRFCAEIGVKLIVHTNRKAIQDGASPFLLGTQKCCGLLKTRALLDALEEGGFDAAFGGARRDEEKSRAKERVYSLRDAFGQWNPKNQRPELWNLFNSRIDKGESIRVFPLSNWTELDVWHYIHAGKHPHRPPVFRQAAADGGARGDADSGGARHSAAARGEAADGDVPHAVAGLHVLHRRHSLRSRHAAQNHRRDDQFRRSERENRVIDHDQDGSMEIKKREGYF